MDIYFKLFHSIKQPDEIELAKLEIISLIDDNVVLDPIFSSKDKRFGMGLPLVKRIVSEHMGDIEVQSKLGKGTTFRIRLPVRWKQKS